MAVLIIHLPEEHHVAERRRHQSKEEEGEESSNRYTWTCVRKVRARSHNQPEPTRSSVRYLLSLMIVRAF